MLIFQCKLEGQNKQTNKNPPKYTERQKKLVPSSEHAH